MDTNNIVITISIALAVLAFIILVIFLIIALVSLSRSLKRSEQLLDSSNDIAQNVSDKLHAFDLLFERGSKRREELEEEQAHRRADFAVTALDFVEWGLMGLTLVMALRKKSK